jgi:hypothetical protein
LDATAFVTRELLIDHLIQNRLALGSEGNKEKTNELASCYAVELVTVANGEMSILR